MLNNVFPAYVAEALKEGRKVLTTGSTSLEGAELMALGSGFGRGREARERGERDKRLRALSSPRPPIHQAILVCCD